MRCRPICAAAASILCAVAVIAAPAIALIASASAAQGQSLTAPDAPRQWSPPGARKSRTSAHVKSCSSYGAGFVNIPGTDSCVKVGGWVTLEGTTR